MKTVNVIFIRHANADGPEKTVLPNELARAYKAGRLLRKMLAVDTMDAVTHTALIRSAQTAIAVVHGFRHREKLLAFHLAEAIPELGSQALVSEIMSDPRMDSLSEKIGNFAALLEIFGREKAMAMAERFMEGVKRVVFSGANDGEYWLVCAHSPVIEMLVWHFYHHSLEEMPEEYKNMATLDAVAVRFCYREDGFFAEVLGKIKAPPRES